MDSGGLLIDIDKYNALGVFGGVLMVEQGGGSYTDSQSVNRRIGMFSSNSQSITQLHYGLLSMMEFSSSPTNCPRDAVPNRDVFVQKQLDIFEHHWDLETGNSFDGDKSINS